MRFLHGAFCVLVLFLAFPHARAEEPASLRWRFAEGDVFRILTESRLFATMSMQPVGPGRTEKSLQVERCLYEVHVASVAANGTARLRVRFLALEVTSGQRTAVLRFRCAHGEDGWVPTLESTVPKPDEARILAMLGPVLVSLADTPTELDVTPTGVVSFADASEPRDPFDALPPDLDAESRKMLAGLRHMVAVDDGFATGLSLAFVRLPEAPVASGATWPVQRAFPIARLAARGEGEATLVEVASVGGAVTAEIREAVPCAIDATGYCERLAGIVRESGRGSLDGMRAEIDLTSAEGLVMGATTHFDVARGRATSVSWNDVELSLAGRMAIHLGSVDSVQDLALQLTGSVVVRFGTVAELPALHPPEGAGDATEDPLERARVARARTELGNLETSVKMYYIRNRRLPETLAVLAEVDPRTGESYLGSVPQDPWGRDYQLENLGRSRFRLRSAGVDGAMDSEDDVVWPE